MSNLGNIFLNQKLGFGFHLKRLFKRTNLRGFCMHLGSPIDQVVKYLSSYKDILCVNVDIDYMEVLEANKRQELIDLKTTNKNAYNNLIRPIIKNYVMSLRKIYNNQVKFIVLIGSDPDILKYCSVKTNFLFVLIPENGIKIDLSEPDGVKSREEANRSNYKKYEYRTDNELNTLLNFLLDREKIISL
jgi:hypothetical protein